MFDAWLRAFKDRLLTPWLRRVSPVVRPDAISVLAFCVGIGAAVAAWQRSDVVALVLWVGNRALDGIDGTLARVRGTQSDFGGYLDIVLDFVVYAAIPIGLVAGAPDSHAQLSALALLASFYVNAASWMYLAAILERRGAASRDRVAARDRQPTAVTMPPGLIGGAETVVLYSLFLLFPDHLVVLFGVMTVLVCATVVQRVVWARRALGGQS
jgi:phosphatidylglycerophosphate synthase